jgi:hypothetical protein
MLEVALLGVGYMADIFVFFRLAFYLMVILVFKVLPSNFMFHQNPPAGEQFKLYTKASTQPRSFLNVEK